MTETLAAVQAFALALPTERGASCNRWINTPDGDTICRLIEHWNDLEARTHD